MTDCLIIGFNDVPFEDHVAAVRAMGVDAGAYRDLNLAFIEYEDKPYRSMDILNRFYQESPNDKTAFKPDSENPPFSNADFLWPVVTYLSTFLTERGLSADHVNLFHREKEKLIEKLVSGDILTIAITTTLYVSVEPILDIVTFIRKYNSNVKIVIGGPYIDNQVKVLKSAALQSLFGFIGADFYVISPEGEQTLVNLINALKTNGDFDAIENLAYRSNSDFLLTPSSTERNALDANMVNYQLFDPEEFGEFVTLRTAKSCPFACHFCGFPQRAGKYTYLGVDLVEQELNAIADIGSVNTLTFIDDTFNVPKDRFKELMRMMIRNRYGFHWNSFLRSDFVDDECIDLMAASGCEGVFLGIESGSDKMLEIMNKTSRRKDYMRVIPLLREVGIRTHGNLVIGFPGETYDTVKETIDLIEQAKPDFYRAQLWYADPTTPVWKRREELGIQGSSFNWTHNTMDAPTAMDLVDKLFLTVVNSDWLPQWGFEQWSTFYLQRKGMSFEQIRTFVRCFNAAVKEKVVFPERKEVSHGVMAALKRSCQFKSATEPDVGEIQRYSSSGYLAAETYWTTEFSAPLTDTGLQSLRDGNEQEEDGMSEIPISLESAVASSEAELLACYAILLSRCTGQQAVTIVVGSHGSSANMAAPVRVHVPWNSSFESFVADVRVKLAQAREHQLYAFHILSNPHRVSACGAVCGTFDAGIYFAHARDSFDSAVDAAESWPAWTAAIADGLDLVAKFSFCEGAKTSSFAYRSSSFQSSTADFLSKHFEELLGEARNPSQTVEDLAVDQNASKVDATVGSDASQDFNFS